MAGRLMQVLTFVNVPNGGQATLAHDIRWNDRPVIPDWIVPEVDNGSFAVISCTSTALTIQNNSGGIASFTFWLMSFWSPQRQFNDASVQFLSPLPFVLGGGGGGGAGASGNPQSFRYTATGAEGSDFNVPLPAARASDVYHVEATLAGSTLIYGIDCPDILAGDRTTLQFRVVTTYALTAGDQIDFVVLDTVS